jgi:hypothetical protein
MKRARESRTSLALNTDSTIPRTGLLRDASGTWGMTKLEIQSRCRLPVFNKGYCGVLGRRDMRSKILAALLWDSKIHNFANKVSTIARDHFVRLG